MASEPRATRGPDADPGGRRLLFASAGALAIALQLTLLRELMVALSGDETAVGIGLAAWLGGIAGGGLLGSRLFGRSIPGAAHAGETAPGPPPGAGAAPAGPAAGRWAAGSIGMLALSGPCLIAGGRWLRLVLAPPPGELLPPGSAILLGFAMLAPAGALVGVLFTALAATAAARGLAPGRGIASLYVFEALGSLAGGLAMTFIVIPCAGPLRGASLVGAVCLLSALPATYRSSRFLPGRGVLAGFSTLLLVLSVPPLADRIEEGTARARFRALAPGIPLLESIETPYRHIELGGDATLMHLYAGGQYAGSFPDATSSESLAHTLACLSPHPGRVLVIGPSFPGLLRFLLKHPIGEIDVPEPDGRFLDLLARRLPAADAAALGDPRVRVSLEDPRRFLSAGGGRYDLILVLEPDPVTLLLARTTTAEFYRLAAARLVADGVLVVSLNTAPNELTGETAPLAGAVFGALRSAFPVVRASPGPEGFLVAGSAPAAVTLDPDTLAARWRARGIPADAFAPEMFGILFPPERVRAQEEGLARAAGAVTPSVDGRPVSFLYALARRQTITGGAAGRILAAIARLPRPLLAGLALLPSLATLLWMLVGRRLRRPRAPAAPDSADGAALASAAVHATLVTGACGMSWNLLILFAYQTQAGALYGRIGLLTALFMLGLAAGGFLVGRALGTGPPRGDPLPRAADFERESGPLPGGFPGGSLHAGGGAGRALELARARRLLLASVSGALGYALLIAAALSAMPLPPPLAGSALTDLLLGGSMLLAGAATGTIFPASAAVLLAVREARDPRGAPSMEPLVPTFAGASLGGRRAEAADPAASARSAGSAAGIIEAADHAGAALAALAGAMILVPVFGLRGTALLLAGLQLFALGAVLLTPRCRG